MKRRPFEGIEGLIVEATGRLSLLVETGDSSVTAEMRRSAGWSRFHRDFAIDDVSASVTLWGLSASRFGKVDNDSYRSAAHRTT